MSFAGSCWLGRRARLKRLQDDIFGILERAAPKTLIDKLLNFGSGDLNRHRSCLLLHYDPSTLFQPNALGAACVIIIMWTSGRTC